VIPLTKGVEAYGQQKKRGKIWWFAGKVVPLAKPSFTTASRRTHRQRTASSTSGICNGSENKKYGRQEQ
jgi:hypothetical protein